MFIVVFSFVILIKMSTNDSNKKLVVLESFAKPSMDCQFDS